ncbi:MAG: hypothetical protein H6564_19405 [Lewinellaceae bacterium]|nr:hypothetical protein [Lewinellaceae bacterium]
MKKIILYLLGGSLLFLTSCIETLEEIYLNKDGSGKYSLTLDMSELFANPMMKAMLDEAAKEGAADAGLNLGQMDTIIYLKEQAGAGEAMSKGVLHMTMSDSLEQFVVNMSFPFDEVGQIEQFFKELDEQGGSEAGAMAGSASMFMPAGLFEFSKKKLLRKKAGEGAQNELLAGEEGEFLKMFMASGTYKTVYHLPGKVKKTTIEGAQVSGNTVTVDRKLLDLMEGKATVDGEIRFK